jgi:hypothetical protein
MPAATTAPQADGERPAAFAGQHGMVLHLLLGEGGGTGAWPAACACRAWP